MPTVTSQDGTLIAYALAGAGPAVILVVGAFNDQTTGAPLAQALQDRYTVYTYDRRGRGQSGDTSPYAVEREIEDLDALIKMAGGSASVFGYSSGAVLALRAAAQGLAIDRLVLYDPPPTGPRARDLATQLAGLVVDGRRGEAVELFQTDGVGIPRDMVIKMRDAPFRPALERMAHTLVYEMTILSDADMPPSDASTVRAPTLILIAERNPEIMHQAAQSFGQAIPECRVQLLPGQSHDIVPDVVAPVLAEFFRKSA